MNVVYATDTVSLDVDGAPVFIHRGSHWPANDPLVRRFPQWFSGDARYGLSWTGEPPAEMAEPPVEQATAGPGEKRSVRRG